MARFCVTYYKPPPLILRCEFQCHFLCRNDGDGFSAGSIAKEEIASALIHLDGITGVPPSDVVDPIRICEVPLAAVFEVDQTIPNETENPAFWFFSVHGNNIGFFSEHVNT
mgnify:FL=1|jgi:hypothetical protein